MQFFNWVTEEKEENGYRWQFAVTDKANIRLYTASSVLSGQRIALCTKRI